MPAPQSDEPRTETTLTTRIRINIPGSRPIPPVVMRTPMGESESIDGNKGAAAQSGERTGSVPRPDPLPELPESRGQAPAEEKPAPEPTSDWFAPRRSSGGTSGGTIGGAGMGAGAAAVSGGPGGSPPQPPAPAEGGLGGMPYGSPSEAGGTGGGNAFTPGPGTSPFGVRPPGAGEGPGGPTTGPATGNASLGGAPLGTPSLGTPSLGSPQQGASSPGGTGRDDLGRPVPGQAGAGGGVPRMSDDTAVLTPQTPAPDPGPPGNVSGDTLTSGIPVVSPEGRSPFPGAGQGPGGQRPDLTPRLDPQIKPGQGQGKGQGPDRDPASADFAGLPGAPHITPPKGPSAVRPATTSPPAKKGRSKLVLAVVGLVVVAGGLYGAGLLMNHSDVPKGTAVLGVDIGGGTRDQAVKKLDSVLGERANAPLRLGIGGKTEQLPPENAGLSLDSQATVRAAAVSDYNPVSVIGSLFGQARVVDPVIPVDEEKLSAALTDLSGISGSASDGTIKFEPGKAVAVPGKVGKALDVNQSMVSVRDAYRTQVQMGHVKTVELPVTTREPTIKQAELDRAMRDFAEPAMSGLVTIKAGDKQIQFGPAKSLPKILSMTPIDGKLVEVYNKKAVSQLLEGVFDGITITKGDGKQHPVSADDVTSALQQALLGKTPAERTQVIDLDPS